MPLGHNLQRLPPGPGVVSAPEFRYLTFQLFFYKMAISKLLSDGFGKKGRGGGRLFALQSLLTVKK